MKKLFLLFLSWAQVIFANDMTIGVLSNFKISSVIVSPVTGNYTLYGDKKKISVSDHVFQVIILGDSIKVKSAEKDLGTFSILKFSGTQAGQAFKIKTVIPEGKPEAMKESWSFLFSIRYLRSLTRSTLKIILQE